MPARSIERPAELADAHAPGISRIGDEPLLVLGPEDVQVATRDVAPAVSGQRVVSESHFCRGERQYARRCDCG